MGYHTDDNKLIYAGRVGTGMPVKVLADQRRRLEPLARQNFAPGPSTAALDTRRFAARSVARALVKPKLVIEITYLSWTADGPLRHTVYFEPAG